MGQEVIYLLFISIGFFLGVLLHRYDSRKVIKRLERMNAKALIRICELEDALECAKEFAKEEIRGRRIQKDEEWPEIIHERG